jgi:hypothetical protein
MLAAPVETFLSSIFLNKYAKKWTQVPTQSGDGGVQMRGGAASSKRAAVLYFAATIPRAGKV